MIPHVHKEGLMYKLSCLRIRGYDMEQHLWKSQLGCLIGDWDISWHCGNASWLMERRIISCMPQGHCIRWSWGPQGVQDTSNNPIRRFTSMWKKHLNTRTEERLAEIETKARYITSWSYILCPWFPKRRLKSLFKASQGPTLDASFWYKSGQSKASQTLHDGPRDASTRLIRRLM